LGSNNSKKTAPRPKLLVSRKKVVTGECLQWRKPVLVSNLGEDGFGRPVNTNDRKGESKIK
jgi:hypothetical protein